MESIVLIGGPAHGRRMAWDGRQTRLFVREPSLMSASYDVLASASAAIAAVQEDVYTVMPINIGEPPSIQFALHKDMSLREAFEAMLRAIEEEADGE